MYIIEKPKSVARGGYQIMLIKCSDGNSYSQNELAEKIGLKQSSFSARLKRMGWNHPDICKDVVPIIRSKTNKDIECGDLTHLSNKQRDRKLNIPKPTKFEEELWK